MVVGRPELDPPHGRRGDERERGDADEPAERLGVVHGLDDRVGGGQQTLTEEDEGEQAIALGDVVWVPRWVPVRSAAIGTPSSAATSTISATFSAPEGSSSDASHRTWAREMPAA